MRIALFLLAACGAAPPPATPEITIEVPPAPAPPDHTRANQILAAYGNSHALGVPRRAPTADELAAALDADPIAGIDAEAWRALTPAWRLNDVWNASQHAQWASVCTAGVAAWWASAAAIDEEMEARLAPPPANFYEAMEAWHQHRVWLKQRIESDTGMSSLARDEVGAWHRIVVGEAAWAANLPAPERALASQAVIYEGRTLEPLGDEQARFCARVESKWPLERVREVGAPVRTRPSVLLQWGRVDRIQGDSLHVTRRERETTLEQVPPCKRVRCRGIDCAMDDRHGWRDVCAQKDMVRVHVETFDVHLDAPPVTPKLGDTVRFYLGADNHAVLASAAHTADGASYYELPIY